MTSPVEDVQVTVRYFAAARAAAGRAEQRFTVDRGATVQSLLDRVEEALPDAGSGRQVIARCSVLHNGESGSGASASLADGDVIDLLPPFAGG
ncbi:MoaD/ThiS family protein [Lysobacter korlensis]|uniref:Molybdopterin synthase sulfur carrier subunit n=1 Tax=Lysobacter korlensis TaxID=553636 RepID=A0ABV6RZW4_9GAMM